MSRERCTRVAYPTEMQTAQIHPATAQALTAQALMAQAVALLTPSDDAPADGAHAGRAFLEDATRALAECIRHPPPPLPHGVHSYGTPLAMGDSSAMTAHILIGAIGLYVSLAVLDVPPTWLRSSDVLHDVFDPLENALCRVTLACPYPPVCREAVYAIYALRIAMLRLSQEVDRREHTLSQCSTVYAHYVRLRDAVR